jgi:hypothetical protein
MAVLVLQGFAEGLPGKRFLEGLGLAAARANVNAIILLSMAASARDSGPHSASVHATMRSTSLRGAVQRCSGRGGEDGALVLAGSDRSPAADVRPVAARRPAAESGIRCVLVQSQLANVRLASVMAGLIVRWAAERIALRARQQYPSHPTTMAKASTAAAHMIRAKTFTASGGTVHGQ